MARQAEVPMAALCPTCSKNNPPDARYCYHDGVPLNQEHRGGPLQAGSAPFLHPFVFPNGKTCTSFNQLLLSCQSQWNSARDMLRQGMWNPFFESLGRRDLSQAARLAAKAPD